MRTLAARMSLDKWPLMLIGLLAVSAVIGVTAGSRLTLEFKTFLYGLILINALLMAYLLVLRDMVYGILIYLYSLVFLNFYWRIVLPGRWPDLDIPRLVFTFVWVVFLLEVAFRVRAFLPRTKAELAMLGVVAAIIISMMTNGLVQIRLLLNGFAIPYASFIVAKNVFTSPRDIKKLVYLFAVPLSFYFPINHMFEHYRMTQFVFPRYILSPQVAGMNIFWGARTMGVFLQPAATGLAMIASFVLSLYGLTRLKGILPKVAAAFITVLTPVAVFFTYTRSVYLGFFSAMMLLLLFSRRMKIYAGVIILGVILGVLANWSNVTTENREAGGLATVHTAKGRLVLLQASMLIFADYPFTGVGFDNFQESALKYIRRVRTTALGYRESWMGKRLNQHNHFLNMITEIGLMGFVPLVLVYFFVLRMLWNARRSGSETYDSDFVVVVWAVFAQYLSNTMFMEPRFYEFMCAFPFMLAGIAVGGYQRATSHGWNNNEVKGA